MTQGERDAIREFIAGVVVVEVRRAFDALDKESLRGPAGKSGADGRDGTDGRDGIDGKDGAVGERGEPGEKGDSGDKGDRGEKGEQGGPGERGDKGEKGDNGADGERGKRGEKGDPGRDGRDGVATQDELHELVKVAVAGVVSEAVQAHVADEFAKLPIVRYRGVYRPEDSYVPGDMVSFGGSVWHCNTATKDKPGTSDAWTLAVKHGRDGDRAQRPRP